MSRVVDWEARTVNFMFAARGTSYSADQIGRPRIVQQCTKCGANGERRESFDSIEFVHTAVLENATKIEGDKRLTRATTLRFRVTSSCTVSRAPQPSAKR